MLSSDFSVSKHISLTITSCAQSLYALRTLRAHGMSDELLHSVFKASTLSKLLYASPVWWGFASAGDRDRLEAFIRKAVRSHFYIMGSPTFEAQCSLADTRLFKAITVNPDHVLNRCLPPKTSHKYDMRPRAHKYVLPLKRTSLDECNFITRMLFKNLF